MANQGLNFVVRPIQTGHSRCLYFNMPLFGGSKNLKGKIEVGMNKL